MKIKYPKYFVLLSTFLRANKDKIFYALRSQGMRYPGMETQFNIFMKLIESNQQIIQQEPIYLKIEINYIYVNTNNNKKLK